MICTPNVKHFLRCIFLFGIWRHFNFVSALLFIFAAAYDIILAVICLILKKNDDIVIDINSVTSEGSGIGRYDNLAVFVRGALPGDKITAH
ncbi:MAG: TRAM domain-containing protein, partial [Clostridiales bacterium]|nr:TRAM domain-containing protein [Clostridiales bacterium]